MPLTKLTGFTKKIGDLPDKPTPGSMTAAELKAYYDSSPEELRVFVNNLVDQIQADYALQADLNNLVVGQIPAGSLLASNITVEDSTGLFVSAKVEGALKEAMETANLAKTSASDGKTAVADAVTAKGVTASPSDTFPTLATKIGQINTGKKWASGTVTSSSVTSVFIAYGGGSSTTQSVTVNGLTFVPSVIHLYVKGAALSTTAYNVDATYNNVVDAKISYTFSTTTTNYFKTVSPASITGTGFVLPVGHGTTVYNWIAYE